MKENNWFDPFYIQSHLSEEESNIQKNVRDFCNNELKPRVVESNRKNEFDQNLYPKLGSLGVLGQTVKTHGGSGTSNLEYGLVAYEFEKIDSINFANFGEHGSCLATTHICSKNT